MELTGHISNGVVVFDGGTPLPEGTRVSVAPRPEVIPPKGKRVQVPLVRTGAPGTVDLTNEMIAEIQSQDDYEYMRGALNVPS